MSHLDKKLSIDNFDNDKFNDTLELCRLDVDTSDKESNIRHVSTLLAWIDVLNEVNTEGVEPLLYMQDEESTLREDIPTQPLSHKQALQNAPTKNYSYILLPISN